jgi:hypothetical protein
MLELPSLVYAMRCDQGKTVLAKYRNERDSMFVLWTMLESSAEPMLTRDGGMLVREGTFLSGLNEPESRAMASIEFVLRMEKEAPDTVLFLDKNTRAQSACTPLRVNAPE